MDTFDQYYKKYDFWYEKNKWAYLSELEALKEFIPEDKRGIEIGVGTGRFAVPLNISLGIDPSKKMLEIARQRGVNTRWGFGEDLPFLNATFDYVAIIITICFADDPLKVLRESKRVLKDEGEIILGVIDKDSFLGKFYQTKESIFYQQANFFSVKELEALLIKIGFNDFVYCQALFQFPDEMKSIERPREGYGEGGFVVIKAGKS